MMDCPTCQSQRQRAYQARRHLHEVVGALIDLLAEVPPGVAVREVSAARFVVAHAEDLLERSRRKFAREEATA